MSLNFALKDFYRKKNQTYPYVTIITLIIGLSEFMIYFSTLLGFNMVLQLNSLSPKNYDSEYYFSGAFNLVYSQFATLINTLMIILAITITIIVTTSLILSKKRDLAIMKALGTLPEKMYSYYLLESYIIFLIGFVLGVIIGLSSFGILSLILISNGYIIQFQFDFVYTPLLFIISSFGIFIISGQALKRTGRKNILESFSKDIPYDYDASKKPTIIPRWISSLGHNFKMAVLNTSRRKGEYKRFLVVFGLILIIIITLGLGILVLNNSTQQWVKNSQKENVLVLGHEDLVTSYESMYGIFSNPGIDLQPNNIDYLDPQYLFSLNTTKGLEAINGIQGIDERLIKFCNVKEIKGIDYDQSGTSEGYSLVGSDREDNIPIIGLKPEKMLQNFEIEGEFFNETNSYEKMVVGDGLGYNFFDYPLIQSMRIVDCMRSFKVSGVILDSFYAGYAGYIDLEIFQQEFNLTSLDVNFILIETESHNLELINQIDSFIKEKLGNNFTARDLNGVFEQNINHVVSLSYIFMILISCMGGIAIISLYNYQKAGIMEKAKDFLIMRAIGTKKSSIKKILFLEALFVIIPSLILSAGLSMIFSSLFLLDRAHIPSLFVPFLLMIVLFLILTGLNYLSLNPIMKKISKFTIKDFDISSS